VSTGNLKINPGDINKNTQKTPSNNNKAFAKTQQQQYHGNNDKQDGNSTGIAPS
jgi:hypothetical protein